jgi:hypothetical protein
MSSCQLASSKLFSRLSPKAFIWLFLLRVARIVAGHFASTEIVLTIVNGISCMLGVSEAFQIDGDQL